MSMSASLHMQHSNQPVTVTVRAGIYGDDKTVSINFDSDGDGVTMFVDKDEAVRMLTEALEAVACW
jgi:hypothetical protein